MLVLSKLSTKEKVDTYFQCGVKGENTNAGEVTKADWLSDETRLLQLQTILRRNTMHLAKYIGESVLNLTLLEQFRGKKKYFNIKL